MTNLLALSLFAFVAALPLLASAQGWHRMGGLPDMSAEMLRPPEGEPHHVCYHQAGADRLEPSPSASPMSCLHDP